MYATDLDSDGDVDARFNWWGTVGTSEMDAGGNPKDISIIYDSYDNASYGFVNYAPKRAICFTTNVSTWFNPAEPTDGALLVPGIMIVGQFDPFTREDAGVRIAIREMAFESF